MIKGINRQILEVTNPESPYFDKILFFVSGDCEIKSEKQLKKEAEKIAAEVKKPPKTKKSKKDIVMNAVYVIFGLGAGVATAIILSTII